MSKNIPKFGKIPGFLACALVFGFFAMFAAIMWRMPGAEKLVEGVVGTIGTLLTSAATYHFTKEENLNCAEVCRFY